MPSDIGHPSLRRRHRRIGADLPVLVERSLCFSTTDRVFNAGGTSVATNLSPVVP